jgi:type IV secretory pathway TrbD component
MANLETRQLTINQSMTKPLMIMGCDRTLITVSSLFCIYVGFNVGLTRGKFGILLLAVVAWILIRFALVQMGKKDPLMLGVFQRSMQHTDKFLHNQFFIPANGSVNTKIPKFVLKRWLK